MIYDEMRQDNEMTNCICMVYIENGTKLSWMIRQSLVYEKNEIGQ